MHRWRRGWQLMIDPPIWQWLENDADVKSILGDPPRICAFDDAGHAATLKTPYCVWQFISGTNFSGLCGNTDAESGRIQFDVYGKTVGDARDAAQAIERALQPHGYTVSYNVRMRDPETKLYRYSWDFSVISA